jgi:hypothetical protein
MSVVQAFYIDTNTHEKRPKQPYKTLLHWLHLMLGCEKGKDKGVCTGDMQVSKCCGRMTHLYLPPDKYASDKHLGTSF